MTPQPELGEERVFTKVDGTLSKFAHFLPAFGAVLADPEVFRDEWVEEYELVCAGVAQLADGALTTVRAVGPLGLIMVRLRITSGIFTNRPNDEFCTKNDGFAGGDLSADPLLRAVWADSRVRHGARAVQRWSVRSGEQVHDVRGATLAERAPADRHDVTRAAFEHTRGAVWLARRGRGCLDERGLGRCRAGAAAAGAPAGADTRPALRPPVRATDPHQPHPGRPNARDDRPAF